jgi:pimeloyl-ACP methyl ester carboxylesterase
MKRVAVNDYAMPYVDLGVGQPLVLVHGSLSDYRIWSPVLGPLSRRHRVIVPSLRHFFPEQWDGRDGRFTIDQHVDDLIAFITAVADGPADLVGHSRGGHIAFRLAQRRPDLLRKLVLAEPGGTLDASLAPEHEKGPATHAKRAYVQQASERIHAGDVDGGLRIFKDAIDGEGAWQGLSEADRQMRRDNAFTLLAQTHEQRQAYTRADAEGIAVPTLLIGGADTSGHLPVIFDALSRHVPGARRALIPNSTHVMFAQQPVLFCEAVLAFLDH